MDLDPEYKPNNRRYGNHSPIGIQAQDGKTTLADCHKMVTMDDIAMLNEFFETFVIVDIERLIYLDQYLDLPTVGAVLATDDDAYVALVRCIENDCIVPSRYNVEYLESIEAKYKAAKNGHLEILKWLKEQGVEMDNGVARCAARNGQLEVLKWMNSIGVEMDDEVAFYAARGGHLDILKWLNSIGFEMDTYVASYAAKGGHLEILKWLNSIGFEMDTYVAKYAAKGGHLEVLKWLKSNQPKRLTALA